MTIRALLLGASFAVIGSVAAQAADLIIPTTPQPIMASAGFDWDGLYAGVRVGGQFMDANTTFAGVATGAANVTDGVIGAAVGVNFVAMDPLLLGVEATADYLWGNGVNTGEFFANLRAGFVITDNAMVYALAGVGVQTGGAGNNNGLYQLGGGVEFAVTDAITVRGEVVGQGDFDNAGANDRFFEAAKATVGVFYHF